MEHPEAPHLHEGHVQSKEKKGKSFRIPLPNFKALPKSILNNIKEVFYQSTAQEKILTLSSILVIAFTLAPWAVIQNVAITGINNFAYPIGFLLLASAAAVLVSVFMAAKGKSLPKSLQSYAQLHILIGIEVMQLGLIVFTMFASYGTKLAVSAFEEVTVMPILITFCGVAILGAGLFEVHSKRRSNAKVVLPEDMGNNDVVQENDLESILRRQRAESQEVYADGYDQPYDQQQEEYPQEVHQEEYQEQNGQYTQDQHQGQYQEQYQQDQAYTDHYQPQEQQHSEHDGQYQHGQHRQQ